MSANASRAFNPGFGRTWIVNLTCFIALGAPLLIGYGVLPLANLTSEAVSLVGMALALLVVTALPAGMQRVPFIRGFWCAQLSLLLVALATVMHFYLHHQVNSEPSLVVVGYLATAMASVWVGYAASACQESALWLRASVHAMLVAAVVAGLGSVLQYFSIEAFWAMLSPVSDAGRTYGFIRQPNQQATFLCAGLLAAFAAHWLGTVRRSAWLAVTALLVFALITTGSRTGLLQLGFISLLCLGWLALQKRTPPQRVWHALLPLLMALVIWMTLYHLSQSGGASFYGANKLNQTTSEGLGLRLLVWRQTLQMIALHPWLGHGLLSYGPLFYLNGYGVETGVMMAHSHNLVLQLAFAYGVPVTLVSLASLIYGLARGWPKRRTLGVFMASGFLGCVAIHSLLEFPLWYAYFLLPAAFWVGWVTSPTESTAGDASVPAQPAPVAAVEPGRRRYNAMALVVALMMLFAGVTMNRDFYRLTPVYTPGMLSQLLIRIDEAEQVFWFQRFARFPWVQLTKVTEKNYQGYLADAAEIGCVMHEVWYQPSMVVALDYAGRQDEAKWTLYQFWLVSNKGNLESFKKAFEISNAPTKAEMLAYISNPVTVQPRYDLFLTTCMGASVKP